MNLVPPPPALETPARTTGRPVVFPVLDTMRAVGAVAVVATHTSFAAGDYTEPVVGTALSRLDVGVAIFFVLSGFLLARPFLAAAPGRRPPVGRYLWRRALRILPVYLVTVVAALTLLPENDGSGARVWASNLTMTAVYTDDRLPDGLTQMWSLTTEVAFYAVLPLLMLLAVGRARRDLRAGRVLGLLAVLSGLGFAWQAGLAGVLVPGHATALQWLPGYLSWFATGIALALVQVLVSSDGATPAWAGRVAELGRAPGACWASAAALFVIASTPIAGPALLLTPTTGESLTKNVVYAVIAGLLILPGVFAPSEGRYARVLGSRWPRRLGFVSYSLFCCHLMVIELVVWWRDIALFEGRGLELFALTMLVSLVLSELLYRGVELPFMRLRSVGSGSRSRPAGATTVAASRDSDTSTAS